MADEYERRAKKPKFQSKEAGELISGSSTTPLSEISYSFHFETESSGIIPPSFVPVELWIVHIIPCLWKKSDRQALRATCRGFMYLVSMVWKPQLAFKHLHEFLNFSTHVCPQWPVQLHGLQFNGTYSACDLQVLTRLESLREINFSGQEEYLTDSHLHYLPNSLTECNLFGCTQLTNLGLQTLPSSITRLNLSFCKQITDIGLQAIPTSISELDLCGCDKITDFGVKSLHSNITSLDLRKCKHITIEGVKQHMPPSLQKLYLSNYFSAVQCAKLKVAKPKLKLEIVPW